MKFAVRLPRAAMGAAVSLLLLAGAAHAGDCNTDVAALSQKRQVLMDKLNVLAKATKGKLDPIASCPVLQSLVKAEGELLKYLVANQAWCSVPDDAINNLKGTDVKTQGFASQACNFAVQIKKQKEQAAANSASVAAEAQKLPSGPL